jgi:hypothetical protein
MNMQLELAAQANLELSNTNKELRVRPNQRGGGHVLCTYDFWRRFRGAS